MKSKVLQKEIVNEGKVTVSKFWVRVHLFSFHLDQVLVPVAVDSRSFQFKN